LLRPEFQFLRYFAVDGTAGMIIQEDLGDQQLFQAYEQETEEQCDEYKELGNQTNCEDPGGNREGV
jgi:hypothetical protein